MKKLIIMAVVAIAAVVSQGASVSWTMYNIMDSRDGNVLDTTDYTFYLVRGTAESYTLTSSEGTFESDSGENIAAGSYTLVKGTDADGQVYTIFAEKDGKYYQMMDNDTGKALSYTLSGYGDDDKSIAVPSFEAGDVSGSYIGAAVPEPTSGLLMLVGLGALALRRRRA